MKNLNDKKMSEKAQILKARSDLFTKMNDSQQKMKINRFKEASGNKNITFVNVK